MTSCFSTQPMPAQSAPTTPCTAAKSHNPIDPLITNHRSGSRHRDPLRALRHQLEPTCSVDTTVIRETRRTYSGHHAARLGPGYPPCHAAHTTTLGGASTPRIREMPIRSRAHQKRGEVNAHVSHPSHLTPNLVALSPENRLVDQKAAASQSAGGVSQTVYPARD